MAAFYCLLLLLATSFAQQAQPGLYGMVNSDLGPQLVSVDPSTATMVNIGKPLFSDLQAQELSTIDEKNRILYLVVLNETAQLPYLVGVSLDNGTLIYSCGLGFAEEGFVGVGQAVEYDPNSGNLVVVGSLPKDPPNQHAVLIVTPSTNPTCTYKQLTTIVADLDVLGVSSTLDWQRGVFYTQFGVNNSGVVTIDLFSVDLQTGMVTDIYQTIEMTTYNFNPPDGYIYGMGIKFNISSPTHYSRIIVKFDPDSKTFTEAGVLDAWWIENAGISALDYNKGVLYAMLTPITDPNLDLHLIGTTLDASVVSSPLICTDPAAPTCPWQLEFLNAQS